MGAWGYGIFSDDTACEIRDDYRELLEDRVPDVEATRRVVESYSHLGEDEQHILWLALAAAQVAAGRLDDDVKTHALQVIDDGVGLELWEEAGAKALARRKAALAKLREQLTGPQKSPTKIRRSQRFETQLTAGQVLQFTATSGDVALLQVLRVEEGRAGRAPILGWLDCRDRTELDHSGRDDVAIRDFVDLWPDGTTRPAVWGVIRYRKRDPDWADARFVLAGEAPVPARDADAAYWSVADWTMLRDQLDDQLPRTGAPSTDHAQRS